MAPGAAANKKIANSLVTLSSAAILVVYAAGFMKTRAAAQRIEDATNDRPPAMPARATAGELTSPVPVEPPAAVAVRETGVSGGAPEGTPYVPGAPKGTPYVPGAPEGTPYVPPTPVPSPAVVVTSTPASAPVTKPEETPAPALRMPKEVYADGTYLGWGTSRHGEIQASVKIENGRIVNVAIAQCWTNYSCSWINHLPAQVVTRQGPDVDYVSGATQSANALYWAVVDALNKAK